MKLIRTADSGRSVLVGLRFTGWLLGGAGIIVGQPSAVDAEVLTRSRLRPLPAPLFRHLLVINPLFSQYVQAIHAQEVCDHASQLEAFGTMRASDRLRLLLSRLAGQDGRTDATGAISLNLTLTREELAQAIGTSRQHMYRLLQQFERAGLIRRRNGRLSVPDPTLLGAEADQL